MCGIRWRRSVVTNLGTERIDVSEIRVIASLKEHTNEPSKLKACAIAAFRPLPDPVTPTVI
jgi:hypothetical protein